MQATTSDMPIPIALCLERLGATEDERYTRCTARSGRLAGLAIALDGNISWCEPVPVACELWVSRDQRLMALRPNGAPSVRLVRARRQVDIPYDKPVVLRQKDELVFDGVVYRVHVHGTTNEVHPPRRVLTAALAGVMLATAACGSTPSLPHPPKPIPTASDMDAEKNEFNWGEDASEASAVEDYGDGGAYDDVIEIRPQPPK